MNFLRLDNKRRPRETGTPYVTIGAIIFVAVILVLLFFSNPLTSSLYNMENSIMEHVWGRSPAMQAQTTNAFISALQTENAQLKALLGRMPAPDASVLAAIVIRPPQTPYDTIVLDAGSAQGIASGDEVYGNADAAVIALGKVTAVYPDSSLVTLFSSSGQEEDVLIGSSSIPAFADGRGAGNYFVKLPRNTAAAVGDPVIESGIDPILLGLIEKIDQNPSDAYASMYFKTPVDIFSLRYVQIKLQPQPGSKPKP